MIGRLRHQPLIIHNVARPAARPAFSDAWALPLRTGLVRTGNQNQVRQKISRQQNMSPRRQLSTATVHRWAGRLPLRLEPKQGSVLRQNYTLFWLHHSTWRCFSGSVAYRRARRQPVQHGRICSITPSVAALLARLGLAASRMLLISGLGR